MHVASFEQMIMVLSLKKKCSAEESLALKKKREKKEKCAKR